MSRPPLRRPPPRKRRPRPERPSLAFRRDGTFTILQLTDLHWSNGEGPDQRTAALVEELLRAERPDFVALTGDVVSGSEAKDPCAAWDAVAGLLDAAGVPWAAVFGNHDDEGVATREDMLRAQRRHRLCLSERGPRSLTGIGNYVLGVRGARTRKPAALLYFLDSGAYDGLGLGHYAWIARDQIDWFAKAARGHRETSGAAPPGLVFFHIPLPEWDEVWRTQPCRGHRHEPVCGPAVNSGFFTALVEARNVKGAFCGHDHVNDFEGELHGIRLCYGRATGFGEYGHEGYPRGGRVIRLREGGTGFETWVRVEGGLRVESPLHEP